jgi:cyclic pyranopterin phosphate synthase
MVDITSKPIAYREAVAYGRIRLRRETIELVRKGVVEKGDPITIAQLAAINAAKKTYELLPLCHPIPLTHVDVSCKVEDEEHIGCTATVKTNAQTGVEMEALMAVTIALLNIWDVVKKYEKDEKGQYPYTAIELVKVVEKRKELA